MRSLCSKETLAPSSVATHKALLSKHPPRPADRREPPPTSASTLIVSSNDVKKDIRSFVPGSAGGWDGLRPQHLKDMTDDLVAGVLCETLAEFANLVFTGGVPETVRPVFFGASLFPFIKKVG